MKECEVRGTVVINEKKSVIINLLRLCGLEAGAVDSEMQQVQTSARYNLGRKLPTQHTTLHHFLSKYFLPYGLPSYNPSVSPRMAHAGAEALSFPHTWRSTDMVGGKMASATSAKRAVRLMNRHSKATVDGLRQAYDSQPSPLLTLQSPR